MSYAFAADPLRTFVAETLQHWQIPGVAVTIVYKGEVLFCEGFGWRNIAARQPVTAQTLFPIASCTKAFTAMSLGLLVDEGAIAWDTPIRTYLPEFKLHDVVASERLTPRDLLTHRSGLPAHNLVWYATNFSRQEVFERLQYLELNKDIRTTFQYNNLMYMVAGLLVSKVTGLSWETFVQKRIFDALGMRASTFSTISAQAATDVATPYLERDGELHQIPFYENDGENDAVGPSGNIISCAADMACWLRAHTNAAATGDGSTPFVSSTTMGDMHTPQIVLGDEFGRMHFDYQLSFYGLGWFLRTYKGQVLSEHGGSMDGFSALTSVLPAANLAVAVLCNGDATAIPTVITHQIYDQLLGLPATDWNARLKPLWDGFRLEEQTSHMRSASQRQAGTRLSHELTDYLGEYANPGYGVIKIRTTDAETNTMQLVINDKITMPLTHYHYDQFEAYWAQWNSYMKLSFATNSSGHIAYFTTQMEAAVQDITFVRQPDRQLYDPAFLALFTGEYAAPGMALLVSLARDSESMAILRMSISGEATETLIPYRGMEFQVKGRSGFGIEFRNNAAGHVTEALVFQPGTAIIATRQKP